VRAPRGPKKCHVSSRSPQPYELMKGVNTRRSDRHTYVPNCTFSHQAGNYEHNKGIECDEADLRWQVDAKGFVFASRKALPTWGVAPPSSRGLTADTYQNSTQSRIFRIDRQKRDQLKTSCCRIFIDPAGKTIIAPLRGMCRWAKRFRMKVSAGVHFKKFDSDVSWRRRQP
jgi:hypothetical protein